MLSRKNLNFFLLGLIGMVIFVWQQWPQPKLKLVFCDVGQGDATLIIWQDQQILVDGGPNNRVLDCLGRQLPFWDRRLELVIASHAEADHITGLIEVVNRYRIDRFLTSSPVNDTAVWQALSQAINQHQVPVKELMAGDRVQLGPISLIWLWPEKSDIRVLGAKTSLNQFSQVIAGSFGEFDWLFPGDIDLKIEKQLVIAGQLKDVEVLKVPHHGSKYSAGLELLQAIRPELAVIEVGKNSFGHPTQVVLDRLQAAGAQVKRTDQDGTVVIISNGKSWWLEAD